MNAAKGTFIGTLFTQASMVVIGLLTAFGVELTVGQISALVMAAGFVGILAALGLWMQTVPRKEVVERLIGNAAVVAGDANEDATGTFVRGVGVAAPRRALTTGPVAAVDTATL